MMKIVFNIIVTFMSLTSFGLSIYFYIFDTNKEKAFELLIASIVFLILLALDRLKELSVLGVLTAKLRDKVKEADNLIVELREISMFMSKISLSIVTRLGRWGVGYSFEEKYKIEKDMIKILKKLEISDKNINELISESGLDFYTLFDMLSPVYSDLKNLVNDRINEEGKEFKNKTITAEIKPKHDEWIETRKSLFEALKPLDQVYKYGKDEDANKIMSVLDFALSQGSIIPTDIKEKVQSKFEKDILAAKQYAKDRTFPDNYRFIEIE